jgi:hypothetical protein
MSATKWMLGFGLLALSTVAAAGDTTGTYMTFGRAMTESTLADGSHARLVHYYHAGTSEKADSPFANKTSECVARMIVSSAGKLVAGSGSCFAQDSAGNGGSWTWKLTEAGTDKCPTACGTFKWVEGYGNAKNATASGTFKQTFASKEGVVGNYTVTYTP